MKLKPCWTQRVECSEVWAQVGVTGTTDLSQWQKNKVEKNMFGFKVHKVLQHTEE